MGGLCVAAPTGCTQWRELRPIHDRCKCTTAPVTEEHDPADNLNAVDLARIYELSGGTSGAHLKRTRYQIDEHGELGPVLVPSRKYKPRGKKAQERADDAAVSEAESPAEVARRHLPILEGNLAKLRGDGLPEGSPQITYHRNQIAKYRETLSGDRDKSLTRGDPPSGSRTRVNADPTRAATQSAGGGGGRPPGDDRLASAGDDDPRDRLDRLFSGQAGLGDKGTACRCLALAG